MNYSAIPDELKAMPNWVCANRDSKVPMRAYELKAASASNPNTWDSFDSAVEAVNEGVYDYAGYVFSDAGIVGIDIDKGFDEDYLLTDLAEDVIQALEMYHDSYHTFPIDSIQKISNIEIKKNKRNYRKQEQHMKIMRATRDVLYPDGSWRYRGGRKLGSRKYKKVIEEWRKSHENGSIKECIRDTGISRSTVYRYWDEV